MISGWVVCARRQAPGCVDADAGSGTPRLRDRHLGLIGPRRQEPVQRPGNAVTRHRARAAREDRRHRPTLHAHRGMTHGVDTAVEAMEAAAGDPTLDRIPTEPQPEQLPHRDDRMLPRRERRKRNVRIRG
ncbi:MAG: hypothetical protein JWN32_443 [Solirubrobacterales bacterium]|jgi:hypothetical protein|nr:hypothetical protein [Solirubrobacterales bacterium]